MTEDKQNIGPPPKFYFTLQLGDGAPAKFAEAPKFAEAHGLQTEAEASEFRHGSDDTARVKIPGVHKANDVTLRRGVVAGNSDLWNWLSDVRRPTVKRRTVTLTLHDESGKPATAWRLDNAWPVKFTAGALNAEGNDVAIESLELAHESIERVPP